MNFKPKLTAFDLDGTLAESKQPLSAEVGELLSELLSHMPVAIMSGAGFRQFELQFFPAIPESAHFERLYIFPTNAAQCFIYKDKAWRAQYDKSFNSFERGRIMQAIKEGLEETALPTTQNARARGARESRTAARRSLFRRSASARQ